MEYWKKKIEKEFNVYIKKINLKDEHGVVNIYIVYETVDEKSIDVIDKIFNDPIEIYKYLKRQEEIINLLSVKPETASKKSCIESDVWVEHTLKDFKGDNLL